LIAEFFVADIVVHVPHPSFLVRDVSVFSR